jgi:hypothetical protein
MVVKLTEAIDDVLLLDEYHDFVLSEVDFSDFESLCDSAWALKALANNRTFLGDAINQELKAYLDGRANPNFSANTILLHRSPSHTIRANVWAPLSPDAERRTMEATAYSYFAFHDHNFHFVTAGYLGRGYETVLYRHRFERERGGLNAAADLHYVERARLDLGAVMTYRAFYDVHAQLPPEEVSISLNLMAHPPEFAEQPQYFFDMETKRIATAVCDGHESFGLFIRMAEHVGNADTLEILAKLAQSHAANAVREAAFTQLLTLCPGDADYFCRQLGRAAASQTILPARAEPPETRNQE